MYNLVLIEVVVRFSFHVGVHERPAVYSCNGGGLRQLAHAVDLRVSAACSWTRTH